MNSKATHLLLLSSQQLSELELRDIMRSWFVGGGFATL
jgi:hypothetical protein